MSKLPDIGTNIFSIMSKMANDHGAINLAQGFPNFSIDPELNKALHKDASSGLHQYAPMAGNLDLLKTIVKMNLDKYRVAFDPNSELLVTAGATQGIFTAIQALIHDGDEVVVLDPAYDCYDPSIRLVNGKCIHVGLNAEFMPNWEKIRSSVSSKTKMIIINNPHNPAGTLWGEADYLELEKLVEEYPQLLILADEVYEYITFGKAFISSKERIKLKDRLISVSSFGKTFHITGWKIGYLTAPDRLMIEIKKVHQFLVFAVNNIGQNAIAEYGLTADFSAISEMYQKKQALFENAMRGSKFDFLPCNGTFFQLAKYDRISDEPDTEFVKSLIQSSGVAALPISVFNADGKDDRIIRFCFAKTDETLIQAAKQLCQI